ncbi:DEAD/DEAH box helicase-like protein (plasmid) [Anabaenopsis circularis NIES-21]|uniref:DEAD/DEAH box helicase-like protein n=1 Tax=Anabaenopsis circularis NIES-21 TaxID=1085406 RepID=A0A1Z4GQT3_9CYAN|nr:DEAD/DEAH box helicase-like protein [Anabaenopsis circularis NIES-21]
MTDNKPTDYAAIIRAANQTVPEPPQWLSVGKQVYSPEYGVGEVMALLGRRLIVKFVEEVTPTQFGDWEEAIAIGSIQSSNANLVSSTTLIEEANTRAATVSERIHQIPHLAFQSVAQELIASITAVDIKNPNQGIVHTVPSDLPPALRLALQNNGIDRIYSHQLEALTKLRAGFDLSITTPTASGKTLCYNLAILESCIKQPQTTALYIFPLKALALDQMRKLQSLVKVMPNNRIKLALMTGDTPTSERQRFFIPNPPNILAVSPDLLHHYLYNMRRRDQGEGWRQFLRQLRYCVIDESHTYIGAFGAHFANLMRRLRLAVDAVGGNSQKLQFICSSATIGNPQEMALRFSGRTHQPQRLHLIERSGAASAGRTLLCLAPNSAANVEASKIVISWLQHNLSGIVFCNSRAAVKGLLGLIQRETQRLGLGYLTSKVAVFYSSLTGDRRREIIQKLQAGQIKVIISTSSLEAGIDLPELDCCLLRGFPGSLMSFWQRVGRAGRKQHGLVIYLPLGQNPIDVFYARHSEQLLSGEVESAAFNPDYPTILGKHLECGCIESSLALKELNSRFGKAADAVAGSLLQQNKIFLSNNGKLWGRGYPHKDINLRSSPQTSISLIEKHTGEILEIMSLSLAHREVFPQAVYMVQDDSGELIAYRSESLNEEKGEALLAYLGKDTDLFTEAESELDIQPLSTLVESKIIPTKIKDARLRLTLVWGEITNSVTGYRLMKRTYGMTCKNQRCGNYKKPLDGKTCSLCRHPLGAAEVTKLQSEVAFEEPYVTKYQAPCVLVEINEPLQKAIQVQVNKYKQEIITSTGGEVPEQYQTLWTSSADFTAVHSIQHQIVKAVPLVVLSSSLDVDGIVTQKETRTIGYFFDTCEGGNGAAEAIFSDLTNFAAKAYALAVECDCEAGCPRCLHSTGCPQHNEALHKDLGLFLLDAISQATQNT